MIEIRKGTMGYHAYVIVDSNSIHSRWFQRKNAYGNYYRCIDAGPYEMLGDKTFSNAKTMFVLLTKLQLRNFVEAFFGDRSVDEDEISSCEHELRCSKFIKNDDVPENEVKGRSKKANVHPEHAYKIHNKKTGKYASPSNYGWSKNGKTWSQRNQVGAHLSGYTRYDADDVDVVEYELVEVSRTPVKEWKSTK